MWRAFIGRIAGLPALADRANTIYERAAKLFQLHQSGLLARYYIIEFV
jgi:hypothetical protein